LCLSDHVVNQTNEGAERVVVLAGEPQHAGLELVLLLLKDHRLVLVGLAHLRVFHVLFLLERSAFGDDLDESFKLLKDIINLFIVVALDASCAFITGSLLLIHERLKLVRL
jgi:hypothetical protein